MEPRHLVVASVVQGDHRQRLLKTGLPELPGSVGAR
jgi:hypothetical protein